MSTNREPRTSPITNPMMNLKDLSKNTLAADVLREMIGCATERPDGLEVDGPTGAGYGEKSLERLTRRLP